MQGFPFSAHQSLTPQSVPSYPTLQRHSPGTYDVRNFSVLRFVACIYTYIHTCVRSGYLAESSSEITAHTCDTFTPLCYLHEPVLTLTRPRDVIAGRVARAGRNANPSETVDSCPTSQAPLLSLICALVVSRAVISINSEL